MAEGYFQESFFIDRWILIKNYHPHIHTKKDVITFHEK